MSTKETLGDISVLHRLFVWEPYCPRDLIYIRARISNSIHSFVWNVNDRPCPNFNCGSEWPPLMLEHGRVITPTFSHDLIHGPLARHVKLGVAHVPGMPGTFSAPLRISDPDMHHGKCVAHVPWCMPGSLISGSLWSRLREKRSRHSRRLRNP